MTDWFPALGVAVRDGHVYRHGLDKSGTFSARVAWREQMGGAPMASLGSLPGARADVLAGKTAGRRRSGSERLGDTVALAAVVGPLALLAAGSRRGTGIAVVTFADGTVQQRPLTDKTGLLEARAEAVRFTAMAAAAAPATPEAAVGVAGELERLTALHASGALSDKEFQAAKARIITGL